MTVKLQNGYYVLDARNLKQIISGKKVDVIITSPPYGSLKDYGVENQIGYGQNYDTDYLNSLEEAFKKCLSVTKDSGSLWIVADTFKQNGDMKFLPFDLAKKLQNLGWNLRDIIIWNKRKTLPWSRKGQLRNIFEYILFFTKGLNFKYYIEHIRDPEELKEWWVKYPERYNPKGKAPTNIWTIPIPTQGSWNNTSFRHFCPFPPELVERILLLTTKRGDLVMDPFAGSGVVLAQASCMGRKWVGFDINHKYKKMFHSIVTNLVSDTWESRKDKIKEIESRRETLESKINRLRLLKYPKSLVKEISKELKRREGEYELSLKAIIALKRKFNPGAQRKLFHFLKEEVVFIFGELSDGKKQLIKELAELVISRKPLSKFGIFPNLRICSLEGFRILMENNYISPNSRLYLYTDGNTHFYTESKSFRNWFKKITAEEWKGYNIGTVPPILSNVQIKQELIHTWKPKR